MTYPLFQPPWWLSNPHAQTIWPTLCRKSLKNFLLKRERFELDDGDFLDLDWTDQLCGPIVLVLHGFEGSIESPYAKGMLKAISDNGWRGVLMHFRSCSGEHNRLPRLYHSGETGDLGKVVAELKRREPDTPIAVIGFSLGGNVLLKWLGETGANNPLVAAIAISVPFELNKAADRINQGLSRFYQWHLLRSVRNKVKNKFQKIPVPFPLPLLAQLRTLRDFDDQITAPLHGFIDANDYYTKASCRQYLNRIAVPTLLLQAKDDPFMSVDLLPTADELSSNIIFELTEKGGHVGFVTGKFPWQVEYWLEQRVPTYLANFL